MSDDAGAMLLRAGLVAEDQLAEARRRADDHGGTVPEHLVLSGALDDEALTSFYRTHLMVPRVDPSRLSAVTRGIIGRIPADMAAEFRTVPVAIDTDNNLTVVMSDPSDTAAVDEIAFFTGSYVVRAVATQAEIAWALAHYYDQHTLLYARTHRDRSAGDSGQQPALERAPTIDDAEEDTVEDGDLPLISVESEPDDDEGDEWDDLTERPRRPRSDTGETQPIQTDALRRRYQEAGSPPELAARSGELEVHADPHRTVDDLPTVVLDEAALIAAIEGPPADEQVPILLDRPRSAPMPALEIEELPLVTEDDGDERDDREPTQPERPARRRTHKPTRLGLGFGGAGTLSIPVAPREGEIATPEPIEDGAQTAPIRTPKRFATGEVDAGWELDDWGPPGTTIPPGYLGAVPEAVITGETGPNPVGDDDAVDLGDGKVEAAGVDESGPTAVASVPGQAGAVPAAAEVDESGPTAVARAPGQDQVEPAPRSDTDTDLEHVEDDEELEDTHVAAPTGPRSKTESGLVALGEASARLLATLRRIDAAHDREALALCALEHLGESFRRVAFLVVRRGVLSPRWVRDDGESRRAPEEPTLAPDVPSTLGDVVRARLPYIGPLHDEPSRELLAGTFGAAPADVLAVPVTVRDRSVAVLVGTERCGELVEEHTAVVLRALSDALERLLIELKLRG